jgi:hypothetical protein
MKYLTLVLGLTAARSHKRRSANTSPAAESQDLEFEEGSTAYRRKYTPII